MKKTPYIVIGIAFLLFNVIAFAIPIDRDMTFWIAYIFSVIAYAVQAFVWYRSIEQKESLKSKLLGASVVYISIVYLILQMIAFFVFMFISDVPTWCAVLVCTIILGISAICMTATSAGTAMSPSAENKIAIKRQFIKNLQTDVELLAESESNPDVKEKLKELAKKIRLSDPISDSSLSELENELVAKVASINNSSNKLDTIKDITDLLLKRNKLIMRLKNN